MKQLVQPGSVRQPRLRLLVDGSPLAGAAEAEVTSNNHFQADRFHIKAALNAPNGESLDWWGGDQIVGNLFDVRVSLDGAERSLIIGEADTVEVHPETGVIEVSGRDLSSRLIDNQLQEAFQNKTSSEIATALAQRRGLTPKVTSTSTPVERYYAADHDRVSHDQFNKSSREWDLLKWLAQQEGFDLYVKGKELHFEKPVDDGQAEPYGVHWHADTNQSNVNDMRLGRSLTLAKDVVVVVRSWHSGHGRGFSKTSPASRGGGSGVYSGKAQRFVYTRPNLTEDQAQKLADSLRADISKHERTISLGCPGELDLTVRDVIALSGCGGWDGKYFVDTITRRISFGGGFAMNVTAKNHKTESDVAAP